MADLSGQTIKGYELRECIGSGDFGAVYRAHQPAVNRDVAVKVILAEHADQPDFIRRFEGEAQVVARLEHPHIVPLYDYWREPGGAYLVMRWLPTSLQQALVAGPWPLDAIGRLLMQAASALQAAHRHGVVHRDVKPANILLDEDRNAYLADFGVAKILDVVAQRTGDGTLVGSPAYSAPEQIRSEPVTVQTDLYSLGLVLYELLTGTPPFSEATTPTALIYKHLNEALPSVKQARPELPLALDTVVQTATAKDPSARYPDALRMAAAYNAMLEAPRRLAAQPLAEPLTERELEILRLMVADLDNNQIAERLVLTIGTVRWYVKQICGKLDVHSRAQAVERARELRLTDARLSDSLVRAVSELPEMPEPVTVREIAAPSAIPSAPLENPYKGLRAFQEADAPDFFGREALVQQLLDRLAEDHPLARFLAVVGPSGSGKSSVVRAGLIPALRAGRLPGSERWFLTDMLPGTHPFEEIEAALNRISTRSGTPLLGLLQEDERGLARAVKHVLPSEGSDVLLVIDQFEELFTLLDDEAERICFLDSIRAAITDPRAHVRIILTLRADFYDRPLLYGAFAELMRERTEVIVPLNGNELRQAVTGPADRAGLEVEASLIQAVVSEVAAQPGALPLFQYALTEAFEARQDHTLTLEAYQAIGGLSGALARRADDVYAGLSAGEQAASRQLFLRLVTLGEGVEDTRRRALQSELLALGDAEAMQSAIDAFDRARLLSFDRDPISRGPTVEVAHEAILREWTRLRGWLDESRADVRTQRLLAGASTEWAGANRDPSYLLRGSRLAQVAGWAQGTSVALTGDERAYLDTSLLSEQRAATLRRRVRRAVVGAALVVATIMTFLALLAGNRERRAQEAANEARTLALVNGARAALASGDNDTALALALEANRDPAPPGMAQVILGQAAYRPGTARVMDQTLYSFSIQPSGTLLIAQREAPPEWLLVDGDPQSDQFGAILALQSMPAGRRWETPPVFSPDGRLAFYAYRMSGQPTTEAFLINTDAGSADFLKTAAVAVKDGDETFFSAAFGADSRTLLLGGCAQAIVGALGCEQGELVAWQIDPENLSAVRVLNRAAFGGRIGIRAVLEPDRMRGLVVEVDQAFGKSLHVLDLDPNSASFGAVRHTLFSDEPEAVLAAVSPDGATVVISRGSRISLWNLGDFDVVRDFESPGNVALYGLEFDASGRLVLCYANDKDILIYDVTSGTILTRLQGHSAEVGSAHFMADGVHVLSSSADSPRQWEFRRGDVHRTVATFIVPMPLGIARYISYSPDGKTLALAGECTFGCDGAGTGAAVYEVATGREIRRFTGYPSGATQALFSPDGAKVFVKDASGNAQVWDAATGALVSTVAEANSDAPLILNDAVFSADSRTLLAAAASGNQLIVWDITRSPALELKRIPDEPYAEPLSYLRLVEREGQSLAFATAAGGDIVAWDAKTGEQAAVLHGHSALAQALAVGPDGLTLLSGGNDNAIILWNIDPSSPSFGTAIRRFAGQPTAMVAIAVSPDGRYIFADSYGQGVRQWDVATGEMVRHYEDLTGVVLAPDGRTFASMNALTYEVMLLRIDTLDELKAWIAEHRYVRDFTCEERAQYTIPPLCETDAP